MGRISEFKPYLEERFQTNFELLVFVGTDQERISLMVNRIFGVISSLSLMELVKSFFGWLVIRLLPYLGWPAPAIAAPPHPPTLLQE